MFRSSQGRGSSIATDLFPGERRSPIVTVMDGHPHTLSFLAGVRGDRTINLAVSEFGQSSCLEDAYRIHGIDADRRACPGRVIGATRDPAPSGALALGDRLERPVQPGLRTTTGTGDLTTQPTPARRPTRNDLAARPDERPRPQARGPLVSNRAPSAPAHRWIEVLAAHAGRVALIRPA